MKLFRRLVMLVLLLASAPGFAQTAQDYIRQLEQTQQRSDFEKVFEQMMRDFKKGKLSFKDDDVSTIVTITRTKPYADQVLARVYGWAGSMFGNGRMDQAIVYFMEGALLFERQSKKLAQALNYFQIALIQHKAENYTEAGEYYRKTLALAGDSLDYRTRINCYNGLALILRNEKQFDRAIADFRRAYSVALQHHDTAWLGIMAGNIGSIHLQQGNYDSALRYYNANLRFIRTTSEVENEIETYTNLGKVYVGKKKYPVAKSYVDSAVSIIHERNIHFNDFFNPMDDIYETYARLYTATGDYRKALDYFEKFHTLSREKQASVNGRSLKQLQSTLAFEQKHKELELQKEINEANLVVIRQQRYIGFGFVAVILLLSIVAFIGLRTSEHRKKLNRELHRSNAELERLNTVKDKLFSVISHDLRGPLGNLKTALALLKEGHLDLHELQQLSGKLGQQLEVSSNTLENLLQWAKAQLSEVKVDPCKLVLANIMEKVIRQFSHELQEKSIRLENSLDPHLQAWADPNQVEIILRNLISNAIKFTSRGGTIRLAGKIVNHMVEVQVEDNGIGMSGHEIALLFQPGKHYSTRGTDEEKGTGIGLLITKEMITNNGGSIRIESAKARGTTFTFTLPSPGS